MFRRILAIVTFFGLVFASCTFSATPQEANVHPRRQPRIGFALPTLAEERWRRDLENMVTMARERGIDLIVQITQNDQNQQTFHLEQLVTLGARVLIIAPHDSYGVGVIVDHAREAGIKVISYDRLIMNQDVDLYVSYDNHAIGKLQGRYLADRVKSGNYILLSGPKYDSNALFYKAGAMEELKDLIDSGAITVVLDQDVPNWNPNTTKDLVELALGKHTEGIAAILAPNDGMAGGAISALKNNKLAGKVVVTGQDADLEAAQRIMDGTQSMTIFKDISKEIAAALDAAISLSRGESVDHLTGGRTVNNSIRDIPAILLKPVVVDNSNISDVLGSP